MILVGVGELVLVVDTGVDDDTFVLRLGFSDILVWAAQQYVPGQQIEPQQFFQHPALDFGACAELAKVFVRPVALGKPDERIQLLGSRPG